MMHPSLEMILFSIYLVVIIYSSMLLYKSGGIFMATLSTLLYVLLIVLEFQDIINPYIIERSAIPIKFNWSYGLYKVLFTALACYAVAFLSGFLSIGFLCLVHSWNTFRTDTTTSGCLPLGRILIETAATFSGRLARLEARLERA